MKHMRDLLSEIKWPSQNTGNTSNLIAGTTVFTNKELSENPIKWLKYLLLSKVGLQPIEEVQQQIRRFSMTGRAGARNWIAESLAKSEERKASTMIVVKVVPWNQATQLKNYRIFKTSEIESAFQQLDEEYGKTAYEVWCCESSVDNSALSLGGRITYPNSVLDQQIEVVWFASPRWLESVSFPDFPFPFLRATKPLGRLNFSPQEPIHVPLQGEHSHIARSVMLADFDWLVNQIEKRQPAIESLLQVLFGFGAREVCLPFKVSEGKLTIIDWDTEIESTSGAMLKMQADYDSF